MKLPVLVEVVVNLDGRKIAESLADADALPHGSGAAFPRAQKLSHRLLGSSVLLLEEALKIALSLGKNYIEPEHIKAALDRREAL
jgi:hypothetical protein